ncbi:unnamed protein product [Brachionus calyciflorus]|uniref:Uncharacterized protein n=1 Tax=Brachionus calyciflorus TaxID=104777 RepID=A0A813MC26_9BILA|nr:unnamed protein product [Brachionus calyciflorus]
MKRIYCLLNKLIVWNFLLLLIVIVNKKIDAIYHLPKEVTIQNTFDVFGLNTYVLNVSEYINRLCDERLPSYSLLDCKKVNSDEQRLLRLLLRNYEKDVRPVFNSSTTVTVKVGLTLTQIFDLEEKNQFLLSNVWLDNEWYDEFLKWDPDKFNGLKSIRIPSRKIWLPDLVLYNNAADYFSYRKDTNVMIYHTGRVFWPVPTKLQSTCKFDVTFFPFDVQKCFLKIGSWTYDGFQVDIVNRSENIDLSNYVPNGEWDLIRTYSVRNVVYYPCCVEPFPDVVFTLIIKRKVLYFTVNVILPCLMLSALTLLVFVIPSDSGDKVTLGITVFLAFSVIMLAVAENLPETSEYVPLISVYLTVIMFTASLSVIFTVCVLNLHHRRSPITKVPDWVRKIFLKNYQPQNFTTINKNKKNDSYDKKVYDSFLRHGSNSSYDPNLDILCSNQSIHNEKNQHLLNLNRNFLNSKKNNFKRNEWPGLTVVDNEKHQNVLNDGNHYLIIESSIDKNVQDENLSRIKLVNSSYLNDKKNLTNNTVTSVYDLNDSNFYKTRIFSELNDKKCKSRKNKSLNESSAFENKNKPIKLESNRHKENCCLYDIIMGSMKNISHQKEIEDHDKMILDEWKQVAASVDKILFWIFLIFTSIFSLICLVIVPTYQNNKLYGS